jgi:hypothetical protein
MAGAKFGPNAIFCEGVRVEWSLTYWKLCYFTFFVIVTRGAEKWPCHHLSSLFIKIWPHCALRMLLSYWMVYRSPCAIKNSQRTTRHRAALNRRVFLDYLRPNCVLLNGWHLDSLSKKANFGDDSETYFWLLSKKRPRCALERALGFSKLSRRASEIKNWQRTTRYKIALIYFWTPCSKVCLEVGNS